MGFFYDLILHACESVLSVAYARERKNFNLPTNQILNIGNEKNSKRHCIQKFEPCTPYGMPDPNIHTYMYTNNISIFVLLFFLTNFFFSFEENICLGNLYGYPKVHQPKRSRKLQKRARGKYLNILMALLECAVPHYVNISLTNIILLTIFIIINGVYIYFSKVYGLVDVGVHCSCIDCAPLYLPENFHCAYAYQVYTQSTTQFICMFALAHNNVQQHSIEQTTN